MKQEYQKEGKENQKKQSSIKVSSNINEGIRAVCFFLRKDFASTESTKTHISKQK